MLNRCENPQHQASKQQGGRGIQVCGRWHDVRLFSEDIELVRPGESGGCYVCEPPLILPEASALL